jgi:hypothetical protein
MDSLILTYFRMPGDPEESHRVVDENVIQQPLALPYQWGIVLAAQRAFKAAELSEQTLMHFSDLTFFWNFSTQAKIIYISAGKTVAYLPREIVSFLPKDFP